MLIDEFGYVEIRPLRSSSGLVQWRKQASLCSELLTMSTVFELRLPTRWGWRPRGALGGLNKKLKVSEIWNWKNPIQKQKEKSKENLKHTLYRTLKSQNTLWDRSTDSFYKFYPSPFFFFNIWRNRFRKKNLSKIMWLIKQHSWESLTLLNHHVI